MPRKAKKPCGAWAKRNPKEVWNVTSLAENPKVVPVPRLTNRMAACGMLGNVENPRPRHSKRSVEKQNLQQAKLKPAQAANC